MFLQYKYWLHFCRLTICRQGADGVLIRRGSWKRPNMIYICLRRTTEWMNEEVFLGQLEDAFRSKVEVWNTVFSMPYHIFRHRIKQIAQLNLSRVENALCAAIDEIPEGAVVVPVDDDDWFSPELGNVLEAEFNCNKTGYYWERSFLELPPSLVLKTGRFVLYTLTGRKRKVWTCSTNNYAFIKNDSELPLLMSHVVASGYFDSQKEKVKRIDGCLSIMNRTLASQTSLGGGKPSFTKRELIRKFHHYKELYSRIELQELAWAKPYIKMMKELMSELRLKSPEKGHSSLFP